MSAVASLVYVKFDEFSDDCVKHRLAEEPSVWVDYYPGGLPAVVEHLRSVCRDQGLPVAYAAYEGSQPVVCWVEKA